MDYDDAYVNVASDYADEIEGILIDLCNESTRINTIKRTDMYTPYGFTGTSSTLKFSDIIDTNTNKYGELRQIVDVLNGFLLDLHDALMRSGLERYPFFIRYARIIYQDCNWPSYQFAASLLTHIKNKLKPEPERKNETTEIVEQLKKERQERDRRHRGGKKTNKNNRKKNKSMKKSKK